MPSGSRVKHEYAVLPVLYGIFNSLNFYELVWERHMIIKNNFELYLYQYLS